MYSIIQLLVRYTTTAADLAEYYFHQYTMSGNGGDRRSYNVTLITAFSSD